MSLSNIGTALLSRAGSCIAVLALAQGMTVTARADLEVCNGTRDLLYAAVGYQREETTAWVASGWWGMDPRECRTVLGPALSRNFNDNLYLRVESKSGEEILSGRTLFCTKDGEFRKTDTRTCDRGYENRGYRNIETQGYDNMRITVRYGDYTPERWDD